MAAYVRTRTLEATRPAVQAGELGQPLSDDMLRGIIHQHIDDAMNRADGDLTKVRAELYKRYRGDLYGNERAGYSQYTTREVFEAIEWVLPDVLEVFTGNDRPVVFEPVSAEDKPVADQETDVVNHRIMQANEGCGFTAVYEFCKEALTYPTAYGKVWAEQSTRERVHKLQGLQKYDLPKLLEDDSIELLTQDARMEKVGFRDPASGQEVEMEIEVFDIEYRKKDDETMLKIACVPGEEMLVDSQCTSLDLDTAGFISHVTRPTYTDLVDMGVDMTDVPTSYGSDDQSSEIEKYTRYYYEDEKDQADGSSNTLDPTMRRYLSYESYLYADVEGKGRAQFWKVHIVNGKIVEKTRVDYQPFIAMSAIIQPHKHVGMSAAQAVESMQLLHTELVRQVLNNIRVVNTRRKVMSSDALLKDGKTVDQMLDTTSEWVMVKGSAREAMSAEPQTSIVGEMLPVLGYFDQKTSVRSGVTMENDLDPSALQNIKATNYIGAMEKAGRRTGTIIKCFAETGIKQMYLKVHQLSRQYLYVKETIELRGKWVDIDPTEWQERRRMKVTVGLGHNTRQQRLSAVMQLFGLQQQAQGMGLADFNGIYNTLVKFAEVSGMGAAEQYFVNPGTPGWQPPQPPPDPSMILAQTDAQVRPEEVKIKAQEQERKNFETQAKVKEMMAKLPIAQQEHIMEMRRALEQLNEIRAQTGVEQVNIELVIAQTLKTLAEVDESKAKARALLKPPAQGGASDE